MAWTYEPDNLSSSPRDVVRLTVGDTVLSRPLISDEEIDYLLSVNASDAITTAPLVAEAIAAQFGARADKTVGRLSISYARQQDFFMSKAKELRKRVSRLAMPLAGGLGPTMLGDPNQDDYFRVAHNIYPPPPPVDGEDFSI